MKSKLIYRKIVCLATALIFAAGCSLPLMPETARAQEEDGAEGWSAQIPQMLEAGEYEEGTVVVCIDPQAGSQNDGQRSSARKRAGKADLLTDAEEIMTVDTSAPKEAVSSSKRGAGRNEDSVMSDLAAASGDEASLSVVRSGDMSTSQMLETLARDDRVLFAEPNYIAKIDTGTEADTASGAAEDPDPSRGAASSPVAEPGAIPPADDLTPQQWSSSEDAEYHIADKGINVSMKVPGFSPAGSNMEGVPITVAVLDAPVDFSHPDLADVAYHFSPEQKAQLGCDEHGYNATWQCQDGKLVYYPDGGHGTHCAGILGASWDGHGISGVASDVRIISVQIVNEDGRTSLINALRGLGFVKSANEAGADIRITSNSWSLIQYSKALDAALADLGECQGVVSVFAAGNDSSDLQQITKNMKGLAYDPYVILAASTSPDGSLSGFSNYSDQIVDLGAPGAGILSCWLTGEEELNYYPDAVKESNKLYEGFEGGESAVEVDLVDEQGAKAGAGTVSASEGMVFAGKHAMHLDLSNAALISSDERYDNYRLQLDLGDLADLGVKAGDSIGLSVGGKDMIFLTGMQYRTAAGGTGGNEQSPMVAAVPQTWESFTIEVPEDMDLRSCTIQTELTISKGSKEVWIDSIGAGGDKVPYMNAYGTSMACPAVAGAAAVLASRYNVSGRDLAAIVRGSVRPMSALDGKTRTGGILDLSVDASSAAQRGPAIDALTCTGRTITLTGSGFGSAMGSAALTKEVVGAEPKALSASITSWTDNRVSLLLNEEPKGVLKAVLTTAVSGKKDTIVKLISLSENIYGTDLPLNSETGDPYGFDAPGDAESSGPLQPLGKKLYYLPATTKIEEMPTHQQMYSFDPKTKEWTEKAALPVWMEHISAASVAGVLYVKGCLMDESSEVPSSAGEPQAVVYAYDPGKDEWTECSSSEVSPDASLVGDGKSMYLVGESVDPQAVQSKGLVRVYDPKAGAGAQKGTLSRAVKHPTAAVRGGILYVYDPAAYRLESVKVRTGAVSSDISAGLPKVFEADAGFSGSTKRTLLEAVLLPADDGLLLIGPPAADGSSDTWFLERGTKVFVPGVKRISDGKIGCLAASVYNGSVYVIGSSSLEAGDRVFRTETLARILPRKAPQKTSIRKLKKGKRSFKVTWAKKSAPVRGYQVRYSLKKNFKKARVRTVAGASKTKLKVKKLKKKRRYYVQVRTYKILAGKKVYSPWSKTKKVTTKR